MFTGESELVTMAWLPPAQHFVLFRQKSKVATLIGKSCVAWVFCVIKRHNRHSQIFSAKLIASRTHSVNSDVITHFPFTLQTLSQEHNFFLVVVFRNSRHVRFTQTWRDEFVLRLIQVATLQPWHWPCSARHPSLCGKRKTKRIWDARLSVFFGVKCPKRQAGRLWIAPHYKGSRQLITGHDSECLSVTRLSVQKWG